MVMEAVESEFQIQGRFVKFVEERTPTVTKAVVIKASSIAPAVQVNVPSTALDGVCKPYAYLGKEARDIDTLDKDQDIFQSQVLTEGDKHGIVLYFLDSKVQVTMWAKRSSKNGCVLGTSVCIEHDSPLADDSFVGLLGTPNGNKFDDWMSETGAVTIPESARERLDDGTEFCVDNWCIRNEEESLFTYDEDEDESFDLFEECHPQAKDSIDTATIDCVEDTQANPSSELAKICGIDLACIVEGCVGGKEDALRILESENDDADYACAEQLLFEDFGEGYTGGWGLKASQDNSFGSPFLRLHKQQSEVFKDIAVPFDADTVTIEFEMFEIDEWSESDALKVSVDGVTMDLGSFGPAKTFDTAAQLANYFSGEDCPAQHMKLDAISLWPFLIVFSHSAKLLPYLPKQTGGSGGIVWKRYSTTESTDLGFGGSKDQIHFVKVTIPSHYLSTGFITLKLEVALGNGEAKASAGIDDVRIMALKFACDDAADASISLPAPMADVPSSISLPVTCRGDAASVRLFRVVMLFCRCYFFTVDSPCSHHSPRRPFQIAFDVSTFSNMDYSCAGEGEFILATTKNGEFALHVRTSNYDKEKLAGVPRGIVLRDAGAPTIQIGVAQSEETSVGQCPVDLYVDGQYQEMSSGGSFSDVRVERIGQAGHEEIVIYYTKTGVQVTAMLKHSSWLGCYFAVKLCLPDEYREGEDITGLFGTFTHTYCCCWWRTKRNVSHTYTHPPFYP